MDIFIAVVAAVALGVVGFAIGRAGGRSAGHEEGLRAGIDQGRSEAAGRIEALAQAVERGREPEGAAPGSPEARLHRALEMGWSPREAEQERAVQDALGRLAGFLNSAVREPLAGASPTADAVELRERIARALGSLDDVKFFLQEPAKATAGQDLAPLVQQVTREYAQDHAIGIRIRMDGTPLRAAVNAQAFMDALYLVLHNAGRFGGGRTVDVTLLGESGQALIRVRDHGPGFTEEAFTRAFDPFYSTTEGGLGLGLPQARKSVEGMGGRIELRNVPDGGAEVEISLPSA
jgi:signal transduction histidine kinase